MMLTLNEPQTNPKSRLWQETTGFTVQKYAFSNMQVLMMECGFTEVFEDQSFSLSGKQ